jgi:transcriptional regulator with XRE-family HTH domain
MKDTPVTADVTVPPEALLIAAMRQRAPRISMSEAARRSGISLTRWRQIENGFRPERGTRYREVGPAQTIARMAAVVGISPQQLTDAGRADAADELAVILDGLEQSGVLNGKQSAALAKRIQEDTDRPLR